EALLRALREDRRLEATDGEVRFRSGDALKAIEDLGEPRPLGAEQTNVSIVYGDLLILKLYRRLRSGEQPDVEVARFLTETAGFAHTPAFLGSIVHHSAGGEITTLAAAFAFVPNQGDAWTVMTDALLRDLEHHTLAHEGHQQPDMAPGDEFGLPLASGAL